MCVCVFVWRPANTRHGGRDDFDGRKLIQNTCSSVCEYLTLGGRKRDDDKCLLCGWASNYNIYSLYGLPPSCPDQIDDAKTIRRRTFVRTQNYYLLLMGLCIPFNWIYMRRRRRRRCVHAWLAGRWLVAATRRRQGLGQIILDHTSAARNADISYTHGNPGPPNHDDDAMNEFESLLGEPGFKAIIF